MRRGLISIIFISLLILMFITPLAFAQTADQYEPPNRQVGVSTNPTWTQLPSTGLPVLLLTGAGLLAVESGRRFLKKGS